MNADKDTSDTVRTLAMFFGVIATIQTMLALFMPTIEGPAAELAAVVSSPLLAVPFGCVSLLLFLAGGAPTRSEIRTALILFGGFLVSAVFGTGAFIGLAILHVGYGLALIATLCVLLVGMSLSTVLCNFKK